MADWGLFQGKRSPRDWADDELPAPPPWRTFRGSQLIERELPVDENLERKLGANRGATFQASPHEIEMVNAALFLRRPLLVTGRPGVGKTSLAYAVAYELKLGKVLRWSITTRSTLREGLYEYDAIARLQDASLARRHDAPVGAGPADAAPPASADDRVLDPCDIGRYIRLGPLGTALLPVRRPRVLLIDEIDKSDIDLPNDLLNIFEEGEYELPELKRLPETCGTVHVRPSDGDDLVPIVGGQVRCYAFPLVILTSNGERDFPPAFLRRCLRLDIKEPDEQKLRDIVEAHLAQDSLAQSEALFQVFWQRYGKDRQQLAPDQLLNAIYLATAGHATHLEDRESLLKALLRQLNEAPRR